MKKNNHINRVVPCEILDETLDEYLNVLGYQLDYIFPADRPRVAVVFNADERIQLGIGDALKYNVPPVKQTFVHVKLKERDWGKGRAGMYYRDLIPDRQGGRFIASHIRVPEGGPVADYVHYHRVNFQIIYIYKGWVRVVYEDQGPPFIMNAGDCVLQPPEIRHRVLECSTGFEVVEISCPAEHMTYAEHKMTLPTDHQRPERNFNGQRFVNHIGESSKQRPWQLNGYVKEDTGISKATEGLVGVGTVYAENPQSSLLSHNGEFYFLFILSGTGILQTDKDHHFSSGDAIVVPMSTGFQILDASSDLSFLEVTVPADLHLIQ